MRVPRRTRIFLYALPSPPPRPPRSGTSMLDVGCSTFDVGCSARSTAAAAPPPPSPNSAV
ncbi:hypothetical protein Ga0100231_009610 [Opitutaceae bacterium TAV4]|nr:hypothetical protein Ga0100231_009610 [Opitutaceae bacterium TAV4]